jgi:hypothetical protein
VLTFAPQTADIGKALFYGCKNHNFMGGRLCIVAAGQTNTPCTIAGGGTPPPSSPCDELVAAVKTRVAGTSNAATYSDAAKILSKVVVDLFVYGAGMPSAPLRKYFDGSFPIGSLNYVDNLVIQGRLVTGLVKFFGSKLGCSDNTIAPYAKPTDEPNMKIVHQFMQIKKTELDLFNAKLVDLLTNFGNLNVGLSPRSVTNVRAFLNSSSTDICSDRECGNFQPPSICEKWTIAANAKSQVDLIQGVVLAVFANLTAVGSPARDFFNGKVPCQSRNFVDSNLDAAGFTKSLVAYFGEKLGCSASAFPQYRGRDDMEAVHKEMPITKALFDQFVGAFAEYATTNLKFVGASFDDDLATIVAFFASENVAKICNQAGCPTAGQFVVVERGCFPVGTTDSSEMPSSQTSMMSTATETSKMPSQTTEKIGLTTTENSTNRVSVTTDTIGATTENSTLTECTDEACTRLIVDESSENDSATVFIAVGVVLGVIVLAAAIAVAGVCLVRRKRLNSPPPHVPVHDQYEHIPTGPPDSHDQYTRVSGLISEPHQPTYTHLTAAEVGLGDT